MDRHQYNKMVRLCTIIALCFLIGSIDGGYISDKIVRRSSNYHHDKTSIITLSSTITGDDSGREKDNDNNNDRSSILSGNIRRQRLLQRIHKRSHRSSSQSPSSSYSWKIPKRELSPPFPNGSCGGHLITITHEDLTATRGTGTDTTTTSSTTTTTKNPISSLFNDIILPPRDIQVWLPPNYYDDNDNDKQERRQHPVLYVHDGENTINDSSSWTGQSWRLPGTLIRLADHNLLSSKYQNCLPICVLLPSAQTEDFMSMPGLRRRHLEYGDMTIPWFAKAHVQYVVEIVKPYIDETFNTNSNVESTYTIGASLGGQASLNLVLQYPDIFGGAACLSPAFGPTICNDVLQLQQRSSASHPLSSKKLYIDIGGDTDDVKVPIIDVLDHISSEHWWNPGYFWLDTQLQIGVQAMRSILDSKQVQYKFYQFPGGRHNERAWSQRMDKPLLHLYGKEEESSH